MTRGPRRPSGSSWPSPSTSTTSSRRCGWPRQLQPWFATVKVGLELYSAAGPEAITTMRDLGFRVFADLKLHDIPTTVGRAARVLGALGVDYLNFHAAGAWPCCAPASKGWPRGPRRPGSTRPMALAVTVLTSDADAPPESLLAERVQHAGEGRVPAAWCAPPPTCRP